MSTCGGGNACSVVNPMSFSGASFAQYALTGLNVERHLSVSLGFRTNHAAGNIMYAVGLVDYSVLEVRGGKLRFRFDFGSGEGVVEIKQVC